MKGGRVDAVVADVGASPQRGQEGGAYRPRDGRRPSRASGATDGAIAGSLCPKLEIGNSSVTPCSNPMRRPAGSSASTSGRGGVCNEIRCGAPERSPPPGVGTRCPLRNDVNPWFPLGALVQVVLVELAKQIASLHGQALLHLGVGQRGARGPVQERDHRVEPLAARGEPSRVALTAAEPAHRRPRPASRASSSSRPVCPAASSFASADRYRSTAARTPATSDADRVTDLVLLSSE